MFIDFHISFESLKCSYESDGYYYVRVKTTSFECSTKSHKMVDQDIILNESMNIHHNFKHKTVSFKTLMNDLNDFNVTIELHYFDQYEFNDITISFSKWSLLDLHGLNYIEFNDLTTCNIVCPFVLNINTGLKIRNYDSKDIHKKILSYHIDFSMLKNEDLKKVNMLFWKMMGFCEKLNHRLEDSLRMPQITNDDINYEGREKREKMEELVQKISNDLKQCVTHKYLSFDHHLISY